MAPVALRTFANARPGNTQRIAEVVAVDALPRSAIGKVLTRELRGGGARRRQAALVEVRDLLTACIDASTFDRKSS